MYKYLGDTSIRMYDIFNFLSIIALLIMNMSLLKKKTTFLSNAAEKFIKKSKTRLTRNRWMIAFIEMFLISLVQYGPVAVITHNFGLMVGTGNNYFGVLFSVPLLLMLFFRIIRISPLKQLDMITPAYAIALVFAKIACFCCGCCNGLPWEHGILNTDTGLYEYPVQLFEAVLALVIFIALLLYRNKAKEGTMFPVYLISYSLGRFFIEFLRNEENIFLIFKTYHLLCIGGIILGITELLIVLKYGNKIKALYAEKKGRIKF